MQCPRGDLDKPGFNFKHTTQRAVLSWQSRSKVVCLKLKPGLSRSTSWALHWFLISLSSFITFWCQLLDTAVLNDDWWCQHHDCQILSFITCWNLFSVFFKPQICLSHAWYLSCYLWHSMQDEVAHTLTENRVLQKSRHPFLTVNCFLFSLESFLSLQIQLLLACIHCR